MGIEGNSIPVVLSTRIRLARNLSAFFFPGWAKEDQRNQIFSLCTEALRGINALKKGVSFRIEDISELDRHILVERHLISRELAQCQSGCGAVISSDANCSVMINEEDHLRIQMLRSGFELSSAWRSMNALDSKIEEKLDYAFSSKLGYLTACPTNLGTGLRASVMLHLPGLVFDGLMEKIIRSVNHLGMTVRGLFGEGSDATGNIFQISNQQTLGESEKDIIKRLHNVLSVVIEKETEARQRLCENAPKSLYDKIGRAYGILTHSHELSSTEAMNHLALIRLAVDYGFIPGEKRADIDRLLIQCQPGHIAQLMDKNTSPEERDGYRADFMRKECSLIPEPQFV